MIQRIRGRIAAIGASAAALASFAAAAPAIAQDSMAQADDITIEEVIVTARKREERAIDTPVAVAVMTEEDLDRYYTRNLTELSQRVPGLEVIHGAGGGAGGNITIRGIGKPPGTSDYGLDAPVSVVIDGMPFSRNHMIMTGFFDSEALEVLKGPQALYFGKNSPAGVIAIRSKSPDVGGEMEGFVRASYEFVTEDPAIEAGLSLPVGDTLAFRLAARGQDMKGGWLENVAVPLDLSPLYPGTDFATRGASYDEYPAQKQAVVRFTTVFEPNERFDATLKIFRSYTKRNDAGQTVLYACADGPGVNPTFFGIWPDPTQTCPDNRGRLERTGPLLDARIAETLPYVTEDSRFHYKLAQYVHTLQMNFEMDNFTLSSATGYWDYRHREYTNYGYTSWGIVASKQGESGEAFTTEVRLSSNFDGPLNFTVGAFYEDAERTLNAGTQLFPSALTGGTWAGPGWYNGTHINYHQIWDNDVQSFSLFGSVDWQVSDRIDVSGGLRYTEEDREAIGGNVFENFFGVFSPAGYVYNPSDKSDNLSPEVTVSYHLKDDVMAYLAFKTGFQSAGISNPGTVSNLTSLPVEVQNDTLIFDETTIEGFEAGLKGTFLEGRLRADLAAFWYESKDLQVGIFNSNTTTFTLQNAAVAHNWGFEASGIYQATERLQLRFAGQYNHLEYDEWEDAGCHAVDDDIPATDLPRTGPGCHVGAGGEKIQDLSGIRYGNAPFQANVGFTYDWPLTGGWYLGIDWDTIHHSKGKRTLNQPYTEVPSRTVTHIGANLRSDSAPWQLSLICSNCFNEVYVTAIGNRPLAKINAGVRGDMTAQVAPPRLVTLQATYSF